MVRPQRYSIDPSATATRSFYFLFYAAAASLIPFLVIYYEELGFSGKQIGLLVAIPPLVSLIGAPVWGAAADATKQHKRLLSIAIAGSLASVFLFSKTTALVWIIPIVIVWPFFGSPIMALVDASTLEWLGKRRNLYGRFRVWGAIGWGVAAPLAGWLIQSSDVVWAFYAYILLLFGGLIVTWFLPIRETAGQGPFWAGVRLIAGNRRWLLFLTIVLISGMCMTIVSNFMFLYMNDLEVSKTVMGLSLTFATLSELPVLFYSDRLLGRWGSRGLLLVSLGAYVARFVLYSLIREPWMFLAVQLLHGPAFSAMWVAGVSYADSMAPKGLAATAQGLFSGVLFGLGGIAGALIGGLVYDGSGAVVLFRWAAAAALFGVFLLAVLGRNQATTQSTTIVAGGLRDDTSG